MRIGLKLAIALMLPMIGLTVFLGIAFLNRSRDLLREELAKEGRAIARVVQIASEDYLRDRQLMDLQQLADRITGYERVLGVRLFDPDGTLTYQPRTLDAYPFEQSSDLRQALAEKRTISMRRAIGGQPAIGFLVPLFDRRGQLVGAVQVLQLESYIAEDERATRRFILELTVAMMAATALVVLLVTRSSISRPITRLVRSFREVGARAVPSRVPIVGDDELAWLTREFNGMCERLETTGMTLVREQEQRRKVEAELRNAERLAGLGRLAAGLAHEIGTPLNVIIGRAESLQRGPLASESATRHLGIIVSQGERIARIVSDMLAFGRMRPRRHVELDVRSAIEAALALSEDRRESQSVTVELSGRRDLPTVMGDPEQLQHVFLNLASNALDAMPQGGVLRIEATAVAVAHPERTQAARHCVKIDFSDTGIGMSPEELTHVFDPFFTTKDAGRGTGLGLSVAHGIIEEHGGWFEVQSARGAGTTFKVFLPTHRATSRDGAQET